RRAAPATHGQQRVALHAHRADRDLGRAHLVRSWRLRRLLHLRRAQAPLAARRDTRLATLAHPYPIAGPRRWCITSARAVKPWVSKKFLAARWPGSALASIPTQWCARQRATSAPTMASPTPTDRASTTSGELRDLAQDRVAAAVVGLVAADRVQRLTVEAVEPLDDLRRRQLVVVGDRERIGGGDVGLPRRVGWHVRGRRRRGRRARRPFGCRRARGRWRWRLWFGAVGAQREELRE